MWVLYLGAANGTTVSHVADYTEVVYAVEFAPQPMQDLLEVAHAQAEYRADHGRCHPARTVRPAGGSR